MRLVEQRATWQSAVRAQRVVVVVASLLAYLGCTPNFGDLSNGLPAGSGGADNSRAAAGARAGSSSSSGGSAGSEEDTPGGAPSSTGGTQLVTAGAGMGTSGRAAGGQAAAGEDSETGGQPGGADAGGANAGGASAGGRANAGGTDGLAGGAAGGMPAVVVVSASTEETVQSNFASNADDASSDTKWCASDGSAPQWWQIDLGVETTFTGYQIEFEAPVTFDYVLQVSDDDVNFTVALDKTSNSSATQVQTESVVARGRYVRVYFATLPPPDPWPHWACLREFSLLGTGVVTSADGADGG